ncbi:MAG: acyl-CoA dehydrogenase family protein [Thermodesulfobacteriota bacterium]
MAHRSFLHDLHSRGSFDRELFDGFRFEEPGPEALRKIEAFERLAQEFPPGEIERAGVVPPEALAAMGRLGFFGMSVPRDYGGMGLPFSQYLKVVERMAVVDLSLALVCLAHLSIGIQGIVLFGTHAQKQRHLPPGAAGETLFAYALTEPGVGSDAKHIETVARPSPDGTHYVLSGQKTYITNANYAGAFTVFAQLAGHRPGYMGAFVVERGAEGLTVGEDMPKMGLKASSTAFVRFEDVRVPAENLLGRPGEGFRIAMTVLSYGRLAVCAAGVGLAERSVEDMVRRAATRRQFGVPIARFELVQEKLASAAANAFAGAAMVAFAARQLEEDPVANVALETSHCKLFCTTRAWEALYDAMQVAGGSGYLATSPYEKRMRDYRVATIFEGTTEIHSIYPAQLLLRAVGEALPRGALGRLMALVRGAFNPDGWPPPSALSPDPDLRRALTLARRCGRSLRRLLRLALLRYGKGVASREFLLRRLTWLSLREYGLLACVARIDGELRQGRPAVEGKELLSAFVEETVRELPRLCRLRSTRRERLVVAIAKRMSSAAKG